MTTMSLLDVSLLALLSGALPVVIRTSYTSASVLTPRNDRLRLAVGPLGTACHQSRPPYWS